MSTQQNSNVIDIEIKSLKKKRFRINGDDNSVLEINTSDMGIVTRLSELYPKLQELADKASMLGIDDEETDDEDVLRMRVDKLGAQLKEIDTEMRDYIDKLFDANVSEVCAPYGTMFDVVDGQLRYDDVIDTISELLMDNISKEVSDFKKKMEKVAKKYVPQDRKKKSTK